MKAHQSNLITILNLLFCVLLTGCIQQHSPTTESLSELGLSIKYVDFVDIEFMGTTSSDMDSQLMFYITNKTADCVVFPHDRGVKIFSHVNGGWELLPNLIDYYPNKPITLKPKGEFESDDLLFTAPDISSIETTDTNLLRIVVTAKLCQNGIPSTEEVGDYAEFSISP